ncbi:hypothetical protein Bca52824_075596 [Brassica carinata]|uniref:Uncharacterized protein n=1 Tax=Brassica carinata TaxID=52824 RepID=A0A8X7PT75_BRACI|nr:hypothetical protein Bca52824_075596 [Brassica carinata]
MAGDVGETNDIFFKSGEAAVDQEDKIVVPPRKEPEVEKKKNPEHEHESEFGEEKESKERKEKPLKEIEMGNAAYKAIVLSDLLGQSVAAILGRLYYDNGGKSKWLATVVKLVGFPVLLPYYLLSIKTHATTHTDSKAASPRNRVAFSKVLKRQTFSEVMDLIIYVNLVASCVSLVGLFASGEWKTLSSEMDSYKESWQVFNVGGTGLIFELSSLFSNAISALGLPVVPVLAVIIFHDKMNGLKVISMILAIWGFTSYVYQHYLDDKNLKKSIGISTEESSAPSEAEGSSGQKIQTSAS